jgi:hypothetical protein
MHEPVRQRARELANTPEFAKAQRQRKKVEALFAELKNQIGLRRLRLRRLKFVREQFLPGSGGSEHQATRAVPQPTNNAASYHVAERRKEGLGPHTPRRNNVSVDALFQHPRTLSLRIRDHLITLVSCLIGMSDWWIRYHSIPAPGLRATCGATARSRGLCLVGRGWDRCWGGFPPQGSSAECPIPE